MPAIDLKFLKLLRDDYTKYSTFVESGTNNGLTIFSMEQFFQTLYTIEIDKALYDSTKAKYHGNKITFLLGDSTKVLPTILPKIGDAIFFLDGHWSSCNTGRGDKDCPLLEEMALINSMFAGNSIVIIDDCRLFGKGPASGHNEDWTDISSDKIINICKDRLKDMYYLDSTWGKNDRMIIHLASK